MSKLEKIQNEILSLSKEERELVQIFLKNALNPVETGYDDAWQTELQKRLDEVKIGSVNMLSNKSVLADLRSKIAK